MSKLIITNLYRVYLATAAFSLLSFVVVDLSSLQFNIALYPVLWFVSDIWLVMSPLLLAVEVISRYVYKNKTRLGSFVQIVCSFTIIVWFVVNMIASGTGQPESPDLPEILPLIAE